MSAYMFIFVCVIALIVTIGLFLLVQYSWRFRGVEGYVQLILSVFIMIGWLFLIYHLLGSLYIGLF